ncbi:MAG: sensor histidine kinase [Bacteroidia bacterium]
MNIFLLLVIVVLCLVLLFVLSKWKKDNARMQQLLETEAVSQKVMLEMEEALIQGADAARAKEEILSLIGHNLRGPISVTNGIDYLLESYIEDGDLDEIRDLFNELDGNLSGLRGLVDKLIEYMRSQLPHAFIELKEVDVNTAVSKSTGRFRSVLAQRSIEIHTEIEPQTVLADNISLQAVIGVVLDNAIRFSPDGSDISIKGASNREQNQYKLIFRDQGSGFLQKQSQPFTFSRKQIKPDANESKGVGLGLITAQSWLKAMDGTIFVSDNISNGAEVVISVPIFS